MVDTACIRRALAAGWILGRTEFAFCGKQRRGKVRDMYERANEWVMITTDRQSAFDRVLAVVPFKGRVLSQVSGYWFRQVADIVPHHIIASPHANVHVVRKLKMFPVEFVVRGYLTGVSATSIWTAYARGERRYGGHTLPEGMMKNQSFTEPLITPSTKSDTGDETISGEDIVRRGLLSVRDRDECFAIVRALFERGQELAAKNGLILVDTKYELGRDEKTGKIMLGDEVHTPDSSRYWLAEDYAERIGRGEEPSNIDKEFLRLWFKKNCDPYKDKELPPAPEELVLELAGRYILFYEKITGQAFTYDEEQWQRPLAEVVEASLRSYFSK